MDTTSQRIPHEEVVQNKIRKTASLQSLQNVWAPCSSWKPSIYWGIPALSLWHMLHLSKQTRTVFVPLFKLRKRKKKKNQPVSQAVITSARAFSFSLSILPYSGFEEPLCAAATSFDLSILCPRASPDNICFACTVLEKAAAPIPVQEQLCAHTAAACAPCAPGAAGTQTHSLHTRHCNNMWAACLCLLLAPAFPSSYRGWPWQLMVIVFQPGKATAETLEENAAYFGN